MMYIITMLSISFGYFLSLLVRNYVMIEQRKTIDVQSDLIKKMEVMIDLLVKEKTKLENDYHVLYNQLMEFSTFGTPLKDQIEYLGVKTNISKIISEISMDDILDKISQTGINSLTDEEKNFLEKHSKG